MPADIFISYNREDRERASLVASALEAEGFSVWWDAALRAGETYDEVTEHNLRNAGAVVVLWSKRSANSKWVRAEATVGERSSTLVPALLEDCDRPIRFELVQTADLRHWRGDRNDVHWRGFMSDIRSALARRAPSQPVAQTASTHAASADLTIETTFWNSIKDGTERSDFEAYLARYPQGHFAALAKNRLAAFERARQPAPPPAAPRPPQQAAQQAAPRAPQPQQAAPTQRSAQQAPAPKPAPKKSGNGLIIGGVLASLAAIGVIGFLMLNGRGAAPEQEIAAAPVETAELQPTATGEPPSEDGVDTLAGVVGGEGGAPDDAIPASAVEGEAATPVGTPTSIAEAPATTEVEAPTSPGAPFRDCDKCPLLTAIPGGAFSMGSPESENGRNAYEGPVHEVSVKPFLIGIHEVTVSEWAACSAESACPPRGSGDEALPALGLSWRDAQQYVAWLSKKTGKKYRLPSEAEWEYAARAGSNAAYWWGDRYDRAMVSAGSAATAVGQKQANDFGLYDVLGNAREWVADCYINNYLTTPTDGAPMAGGDCSKRVIRGGAWSSTPTDMRIANRSRIDSNVRAPYMGLRVAREAE